LPTPSGVLVTGWPPTGGADEVLARWADRATAAPAPARPYRREMTLLRWRHAQIAWTPAGHVLTVPHTLTERVRLRLTRDAAAAVAAVGRELQVEVDEQALHVTGAGLLWTDAAALRTTLDALVLDVDERVQASIAAEAPLARDFLAALVGDGATRSAGVRHTWQVVTTAGQQFPLEHQAQCATCGWHGPTRAVQDVALSDGREHAGEPAVELP
jgi:hypothetical protein